MSIHLFHRTPVTQSLKACVHAEAVLAQLETDLGKMGPFDPNATPVSETSIVRMLLTRRAIEKLRQHVTDLETKYLQPINNTQPTQGRAHRLAQGIWQASPLPVLSIDGFLITIANTPEEADHWAKRLTLLGYVYPFCFSCYSLSQPSHSIQYAFVDAEWQEKAPAPLKVSLLQVLIGDEVLLFRLDPTKPVHERSECHCLFFYHSHSK